MLRVLGATALVLNVASAFKDASPFLTFSTSKLPTNSQLGPNVATAEQVNDFIIASLNSCPSDVYVIVNQPGVSSSDLSSPQAVPHLRRRVEGDDKSIESVVSVANVVGKVDYQGLSSFLQRQCGATSVELDAAAGALPQNGEAPQVITVNLQGLSGVNVDQSLSLLDKHDSYLNAIVAGLSSDKYTVIYTTSPPTGDIAEEAVHQGEVYEMDEPYPSGMHTDLKRDLSAHASASNSSNLNSNLPLFEKYQFLSPGIFMGLSVSLLLLMILYVGISAISGLEVSYMAFSKEMGPAAQKKQQGQ